MGTGTELVNQVLALYNKHDWEAMASLYTGDAVYIAADVRSEGPEAIRATFESWNKSFPDMAVETTLVIEDESAGEDTVVGVWTYRATHAGPLALPDGTEIPATGKALEFSGVTVATVRDGKFVTWRDYYDTADWARQLGLMPG